MRVVAAEGGDFEGCGSGNRRGSRRNGGSGRGEQAGAGEACVEALVADHEGLAEVGVGNVLEGGIEEVGVAEGLVGYGWEGGGGESVGLAGHGLGIYCGVGQRGGYNGPRMRVRVRVGLEKVA